MQGISHQSPGDQEAFAELFEKYKNLVYKTAYLMLEDTEEAEEVVQDVFVSVYKTLSGFDPAKSAFTTWLYRITIYRCLNHQRKRRIPTQPLDTVPVAMASDPAESSVIALAERDEIQRAIVRLNDKQRAIIILRYYSDLPYQEIAQVLDIPLGTVKSRLDRALKTLRQAIQEQDAGSVSGHLVEVKIR